METKPTAPVGLYSALAAAQSEMGKAIKDSTNPAFKAKYADLASVVDACMPSLSKHGIAVLQPPYDDETGRYVKTIFVHGASGETVECRVPLIIGKNDMQGYGSAVTYARRYGLMGMAGIAPEDDDGNAAVKDAPKAEAKPVPAPQADPRDPRKIANSLLDRIAKAASCDQLSAMNEDGTAFAAAWQWLEDNHKPMAAEIKAAFDKRLARAGGGNNADLGGDAINY